jgi:hypothetical protein
LPRRVKIGNAALLDSDNTKQREGEVFLLAIGQISNFRVANFGLQRHEETYSYKFTAMDFPPSRPQATRKIILRVSRM